MEAKLRQEKISALRSPRMRETADEFILAKQTQPKLVASKGGEEHRGERDRVLTDYGCEGRGQEGQKG
jgi:hypothetical protein